MIIFCKKKVIKAENNQRKVNRALESKQYFCLILLLIESTKCAVLYSWWKRKEKDWHIRKKKDMCFMLLKIWKNSILFYLQFNKKKDFLECVEINSRYSIEITSERLWNHLLILSFSNNKLSLLHSVSHLIHPLVTILIPHRIYTIK
jgi:hypothetical protein